jgi:hypothetical protein
MALILNGFEGCNIITRGIGRVGPENLDFFDVTIAPPPPPQHPSMDTYTIVGGGGLPTTPHPLNTSSHKTAARRPPHPSYTQQHTTTLHNSTRVHKTTHVPVVFMALNFLGPKWHSLPSCHFRAQKSLDFQCPPLPMPLVMMLHPSKPLRTVP